MTPRDLDKFYTKHDVARACVARLHAFLPKTKAPGLWIEPSAGAGAFLPHLPDNHTAFDIAPEHPSVLRQDFLQWSPPKHATQTHSIILIGNPPFGKNASLAVRFFNHGASFADVIAFIVPRTFRKASLQNRLNLAFSLQDEMELQPLSFLFENKPYDVPCVFQIWSKSTSLRTKIFGQIKHPHFEFSNAKDACFALQRIGANAGRLRLDVTNTNPSSHYYIKSKVEQVLDRFAQMRFLGKHDTSGNPSISKREVIEEYAYLSQINA